MKGRKGAAANAFKGGMQRSNLRRQLRKQGVRFTEAVLNAHYAVEACEACEVKLTEGKGRNGRHFDHDHRTKYYRGTLCADCNRALGLMCNDAVRIVKLADYADRTIGGYKCTLFDCGGNPTVCSNER